MGNKIVFNIAQEGLGRPLPGQDHLSMFLFYTDTLPSGFAADDRIKILYSLKDAENLGIVDTHSDETVPTGGNVLITLVGGADSVWTITVDGAIIGTYTEVTGDAVGDVATGLRAAINALTYLHGFVASGSTGNVALAAPTKMGVGINGGSIVAGANDATGTVTDTQFSSGVGSYFAVMHYHISEFFRMNPKGVLYTGIYAQGTFDGAEVQTVQDYSGGIIRQGAVFLSHESFVSSHITSIQSVITTLKGQHKPLEMLYHADYSGATLSTTANLANLSKPQVATIIGEDGNYHQLAYVNTKKYNPGDKVIWASKVYGCKQASTGNAPYDTSYWREIFVNLPVLSGFSISCLGACLGVLSSAKVHENIAWKGQYNINEGDVLDVAAFANGDLFLAQSESLLNTLDEDKHYIFIEKDIGFDGTFFNDSWTAIVVSNDFATLENNRTMDKAVRNIRTNELPALSSPLYVDSDTGKLSGDTIEYFKSLAEEPLEVMEANGEISGFEVTIDPDQNVLQDSKVTIGIKIVPVGVAREIENNIGFATKIK